MRSLRQKGVILECRSWSVWRVDKVIMKYKLNVSCLVHGEIILIGYNNADGRGWSEEVV